MKFLVVDDEPLVLRDLEYTLKRTRSTCAIRGYTSACQALKCAKEEIFDVAFLDVELGYTNGIVLAKQLKELQPNIHIIFVTSYEKYAVDAFAIQRNRLFAETCRCRTIRKGVNLFIWRKQKKEMQSSQPLAVLMYCRWKAASIQAQQKRRNFWPIWLTERVAV